MEIKIILICVAILVLLIGMRRGYRRGIIREIKALVSVIVATLCLILIILLKRAVSEHTYATVIVVAGALVILGTGWRFVKLVTSPLSGFKEIGLVRATDSLLGAVAGIAEGAALIYIALKILEIAGFLAKWNISF